MIIYNNEPGNTAIYAAFQLPLPAVTISQDAAEAILADTAKEESGRYAGKMMVSGNVTTVIDDAQQIHMSEFSSWGVPGDLTLKPEITAPGGNIYSTADQGGYTVMSGTSMAAPSVTGMAALVAQYIQENQLDVQEQMTVRALAQSLLMGTAIPSMDPAGDMVEYSPRSQGRGPGQCGPRSDFSHLHYHARQYRRQGEGGAGRRPRPHGLLPVHLRCA